MKFNYIQGVSLPRSGHHLLANMLETIFDESIYCDFYSCCQSIPCKKGKVFQKHHDLQLELKKNIEKHHLIQYRKNPQAQFNAYYRFLQKLYSNGDTIFPVQKKFPYFNNFYHKYFFDNREISDLEKSFDLFVTDHLDYYKAFVTKWIISNSSSNFKLVAYEDLVNDPFNQLKIVVGSFSNIRIDDYKISEAIEHENVTMKHCLKDSPLYQEDFLERYHLTKINAHLNNL